MQVCVSPTTAGECGRRRYHLLDSDRVVYIRSMGRLDRYILREHNGPFWLSLIVVLLVLVTDFIPDVVRMVVSKGLSPWIIAQVFVLNLAWMTALAVIPVLRASSLSSRAMVIS